MEKMKLASYLGLALGYLAATAGCSTAPAPRAPAALAPAPRCGDECQACLGGCDGEREQCLDTSGGMFPDQCERLERKCRERCHTL
jgi:hypothetical protein